MNHKLYKLKNWPFAKGEQAQLTWISSPFRREKKIMIYAYFRAKGRTGKNLNRLGHVTYISYSTYVYRW